MLADLTAQLAALGNPIRAEKSLHYFRVAENASSTSDIFRGATVPEIRRLAKEFRNLSQRDLAKLAKSKYHDERLCALIILNYKFEKASTDAERIEFFEFWLTLVRTNKVNNWDLVDTSAPVMGKILSYHLGYGAEFLRALARSTNLWERRSAIMLTFALIRINRFGPTMAMAKELLRDEHDLIHKAVGWMLREVGKRDKQILTAFIQRYKSQMPRTMLRYAIEKYSAADRARFLAR